MDAPQNLIFAKDADEQRLVGTLTEILGGVDDRGARKLLRLCHWDLEAAANHYLEDGVPTLDAVQALEESPNRRKRSRQQRDGVELEVSFSAEAASPAPDALYAGSRFVSEVLGGDAHLGVVRNDDRGVVGLYDEVRLRSFVENGDESLVTVALTYEGALLAAATLFPFTFVVRPQEGEAVRHQARPPRPFAATHRQDLLDS